MINYKDEIIKLKKEKGALILAHYYQADEIQDIADYVGDSYYLSKVAKESKEEIIIFCGVSFMAESAKILSPNKKVMLPSMQAKCPMAELASKEGVQKIKAKYPDAKVISYINSSTEVKSISDTCCTSSNALQVVQNIDSDKIIFVPDRNLGKYIQEKIPFKELILWDGFCSIHEQITADMVLECKDKIKEHIEVLVHPECRQEVRDIADYIGSTGQIIQYAGESNSNQFLIVTEDGILYELNKRFPDKKFNTLGITCKAMKQITLKDVYECLVQGKNEIFLEGELRKQAYNALIKMHELGR